jgi:ketosteroid isomerase-like protein
MSRYTQAPTDNKTDRSTPISLVQRYYRLVDEGDISGLIKLFEPTAEYHRPGYDVLSGHAELERFYREERVIETGRHVISRIISEDREVAVNGTFEGVLRSGDKVAIRFADFFTTTSGGTFSHRQTFFYAPLV